MLTPSQLAIVMEYAAGGELFARICSAGRFSEDEVVDELMFLLRRLWLKFCTNIFNMIYSTTGTFFLSAAYIWSQLLPLHGMNV